MKHQKKYIALFAALLLIMPICSGCAASKRVERAAVCTSFAVYDWLRELTAGVENGITPVLLNKNGTDMHSFQPTAFDIVTVSHAELFIYIGGSSDSWTADIKPRDGQLRISLYEGLYGEEGDHDHEHEHESSRGGLDGTVPSPEEPDEHIWLSLKNAHRLCVLLTDALCESDPDNAPSYRENLEEYSLRITELELRYQGAADGSEKRTVVFADRFPFSDLMRDYGISVYSAFSGCSSETDASFETVRRLSAALDSLSLDSVAVTESSDRRLARTVIESSADSTRSILVLDSMQSVTLAEAEAGASYLGIFEKNLKVFKEAIN